jgi:hypothetical protein
MKLLHGGRSMKKIELDEDPALEVACPVCEAAPGERCHVQRGVIRLDSHWERLQLALLSGAENEKLSVLGARNGGKIAKRE